MRNLNVTDALIDWITTCLRNREKKGYETYGGPLLTFNGRDAVLDLEEELLDALQYSRQWRMERQMLLQRLSLSHEAMVTALKDLRESGLFLESQTVLLLEAACKPISKD